jgi:type IV pilus biogenesis protein CpaD/CtpE
VTVRAMLTIAMLLTSACAPNTVEEQWGEAYEQNRTGMIVDPAAPGLEVGEGIEGTDGATAEQVIEVYRREQSRSERQGGAPSIINIDTGTR